MTQTAVKSPNLFSMTGYARAEGRHADTGTEWVWDLRSVNGKGLDIRCRLPSGCEGLEKTVRDRLGAALVRGSINLTLTINRSATQQALRVNEDWLVKLIEASRQVCAQHGDAVDKPTFDGLLQVKGVIEASDPVSPCVEDEAALQALMLKDLDLAIAQLKEARQQEGERMAEVVTGLISGISALVRQAETNASVRDEALRDRLQRQVRDLLAAQSDVSGERLAQELAILATRYDIREELDRLKSHIQAAYDLLAQGTAIGRKFDFLCQEFNREANTLCSKASDAQLTAVGLELKTVIDRLREQIQNIE